MKYRKRPAALPPKAPAVGILWVKYMICCWIRKLILSFLAIQILKIKSSLKIWNNLISIALLYSQHRVSEKHVLSTKFHSYQNKWLLEALTEYPRWWWDRIIQLAKRQLQNQFWFFHFYYSSNSTRHNNNNAFSFSQWLYITLKISSQLVIFLYLKPTQKRQH